MLVVDTANGEAKIALDMIRRIKNDSAFNGVDIIGGNIATRQGAQAMIDAGVDAVKVGVGPTNLHDACGGGRGRSAAHRGV